MKRRRRGLSCLLLRRPLAPAAAEHGTGGLKGAAGRLLPALRLLNALAQLVDQAAFRLQRVIGRPAADHTGQPLAQVLQIASRRGAILSGPAGDAVGFVSPGSGGVHLRLIRRGIQMLRAGGMLAGSAHRARLSRFQNRCKNPRLLIQKCPLHPGKLCLSLCTFLLHDKVCLLRLFHTFLLSLVSFILNKNVFCRFFSY